MYAASEGRTDCVRLLVRLADAGAATHASRPSRSKRLRHSQANQHSRLDAQNEVREMNLLHFNVSASSLYACRFLLVYVY